MNTGPVDDNAFLRAFNQKYSSSERMKFIEIVEVMDRSGLSGAKVLFSKLNADEKLKFKQFKEDYKVVLRIEAELPRNLQNLKVSTAETRRDIGELERKRGVLVNNLNRKAVGQLDNFTVTTSTTGSPPKTFAKKTIVKG